MRGRDVPKLGWKTWVLVYLPRQEQKQVSSKHSCDRRQSRPCG